MPVMLARRIGGIGLYNYAIAHIHSVTSLININLAESSISAG
jgi:hypothetical protein